MTSVSKGKAYLVWGCAALFYMYQFILRVSPSVMVDDLMAFFDITATRVGMLAALSMYCYSILQIPSGIIADTYGVRRTVLGSIFLCVVGTLVFISSTDLYLASLGRCLLGAGSAAAFLCVSKVSTLWFPAKRRSVLLGMTMAIGTIGALNGGATLSILVDSIGWRTSLLAIAIMGLFLFAITTRILVDQPQSASHHEIKKDWTETMQVFRSKVCWLYAFTALGIYLCTSVIADLWGVSFLTQVYGMDKPKASRIAALIYMGLCVGSLSLTFFADVFRMKKQFILLSLLGLLLCVSTLVFFPTQISELTVCTVFFAIGFFSGAEMLCFSSALDHVTLRIAGTVTGFINCVVMLGGAFLQHQIGKLLDVFWQGGLREDGVRMYSVLEYQYAFSAILLTIAVSWMVAFFLPKSQESKI